MTSATRPFSTRYSVYALGLLTLINVVNYLERNAIFALFEPIKRDLNLTDSHLGWLGSAYVLVFSVAAASSPQRMRIDVSGTYTSNWDDVRLVQDGSRVKGTYVCCGGGTIDGFIEGRVLRFHWHEPRGAGDGDGIWRITSSGRLEGNWGFGQSVDDGGPWTLVPKQAIAQ